MAVHNGEPYLREAVESVLNQRLAGPVGRVRRPDIEFIIIDDASTDATPAILAEYAAADARLLVLRNETNVGLTRSLNRALQHATGRYIARQDADDISLPHRLAAQLDYLENHPEIGLLGAAYTEIDLTGSPGAVHRPPPTDTGICWRMLFHNPFCHSSVMFRRGLLQNRVDGFIHCSGRPPCRPLSHQPSETGRALPVGPASPRGEGDQGGSPNTRFGGYDPTLPYAQDYDLWTRLLHHTQGANLQEPLILYRVHETSITATRLKEQTEICTAISARQIAELAPSIPLTRDEVDRLRTWTAQFPKRLSPSDLPLCRKFLEILQAFETGPNLAPDVKQRIRECWRSRIRAAAGESAWAEMTISHIAQSRSI